MINYNRSPSPNNENNVPGPNDENNVPSQKWVKGNEKAIINEIGYLAIMIAAHRGMGVSSKWRGRELELTKQLLKNIELKFKEFFELNEKSPLPEDKNSENQEILRNIEEGKSYPENSIASFEQAIAENSDIIELDLHNSSDGYPMVIHGNKLKLHSFFIPDNLDALNNEASSMSTVDTKNSKNDVSKNDRRERLHIKYFSKKELQSCFILKDYDLVNDINDANKTKEDIENSLQSKTTLELLRNNPKRYRIPELKEVLELVKQENKKRTSDKYLKLNIEFKGNGTALSTLKTLIDFYEADSENKKLVPPNILIFLGKIEDKDIAILRSILNEDEDFGEADIMFNMLEIEQDRLNVFKNIYKALSISGKINFDSTELTEDEKKELKEYLDDFEYNYSIENDINRLIESQLSKYEAEHVKSSSQKNIEELNQNEIKVKLSQLKKKYQATGAKLREIGKQLSKLLTNRSAFIELAGNDFLDILLNEYELKCKELEQHSKGLIGIQYEIELLEKSLKEKTEHNDNTQQKHKSSASFSSLFHNNKLNELTAKLVENNKKDYESLRLICFKKLIKSKLEQANTLSSPSYHCDLKVKSQCSKDIINIFKETKLYQDLDNNNHNHQDSSIVKRLIKKLSQEFGEVLTTVQVTTDTLFGQEAIFRGNKDFNTVKGTSDITENAKNILKRLFKSKHSGIDISLFDFTRSMVESLKSIMKETGANFPVLCGTIANWRFNEKDQASLDVLDCVRISRALQIIFDMPLIIKTDEPGVFKYLVKLLYDYMEVYKKNKEQNVGETVISEEYFSQTNTDTDSSRDSGSPIPGDPSESSINNNSFYVRRSDSQSNNFESHPLFEAFLNNKKEINEEIRETTGKKPTRGMA